MMEGFPYMLGYESSPTGERDSTYDVGDGYLTNPKWGDCSGDVWALWVYSGVKLNGKPVTKSYRNTAHTYSLRATIPLPDGPELPGDLFFRKNSLGRRYHTGVALGDNEVFEMGDGTGKAGIHTVEWENRRTDLYWARIPGFDWNERVYGVANPIFKHALFYTGSAPYIVGEDVRHYQAIVKRYLGSLSNPFARSVAGWLTVNGVYGPTMQWAVRVAQWHLGLKGTGVIDYSTAVALDNL